MEKHTPEQRQSQKDYAIQLLRAVAAGVVAVLHLAFAFADHVGDGLGFPAPDGSWGQRAVALFFLVSGYIMVVASGSLFGEKRAGSRFWVKRIIRIMPPYWIATFALVALWLWQGRGVDGGELLKSLALIPFWKEGLEQPIPLLWPGWTLFYEMVFYTLFGLGLVAGKRPAIIIASLLLITLTIAGLWVEQDNVVLFVATRPLLLLFIGGMGFALFRQSGREVWPLLRWLALLGGLVSFVLLPPPSQGAILGWWHMVSMGIPAALIFLAAMGGPLKVPQAKWVDLLGNSSYALYLFHVPIAVFFAANYPSFLFYFGPHFYLLALVATAYIGSIAIYLWVEKPLTHWLNAKANRAIA